MSSDNNDKLDALIALNAKDCGNDDIVAFNLLDTSNVVFNKSFYVKLKRIINKKKYSVKNIAFKRLMLRVAVALMALMSLGFLTIMALPDLREALFDTVVEWYDNYFAIRYEPVEGGIKTNAEEKEMSSVVVPPTRIEKVMKPSYLSDGETIVSSNNSMVIIDYFESNEELNYTYMQIIIQNHSLLFDNDSVIIDETTICGHIAYVIEYTEKVGKSIVWTDGKYYFHLYAPFLSIDELINIALSVK